MNSPTTPFIRSSALLSRADSRLLVIDMQERLLPAISDCNSVLQNCQRLAKGAQLLDVPAAVTEQYPKGLGKTISELAAYLPAPVEKLRFSASESLNWGPVGSEPDVRFRVVVCGVEAHVCVLQTALDLIALGYDVHVAADAVGSRTQFNCQAALARIASAGGVVTTTESVLFEWCEVAGTPEFKQISQLVR